MPSAKTPTSLPAAEHLPAKAIGALQNAPVPDFVKPPAPEPEINIIRVSGGTIYGNAGETDYFVFDLDNSANTQTYTLAMIDGFENGTDKVVYVNANDNLLLNQNIDSESNFDPDDVYDPRFTRYEADEVDGSWDKRDVASAFIKNGQLTMDDILIYTNDPWLVA